MPPMPRLILFVDLAGTLEVRDPATGRWGLWPGSEPVIADLAADFELRLTTGEDPGGAHASLQQLGLRRYFAGVHAGLPGGGKPFGQLAASLGQSPEQCLAIGDDALSDTARDTDRLPSVILEHADGLVDPTRLAAVVRELARDGDFLAGFEAALARVTDDTSAGALHDAVLGGGSRIGWWQRSGRDDRAVVVLQG